jgi:hypothetical protein
MRLFISYAHQDLERVMELVEELHARGHQTWFGSQLYPGDDWKHDLQRAMADCDAIIYALSPHSSVNEWCRWESAQAVKLGKPVLPVLIQETPGIASTLGGYTVPNFANGADEAFVNNLHTLFAHMDAFKLPVTDMTAPEDPRGIPAQAMETTVPPGMRSETPGTQD